jgi:hypothetical protein
MIRVPVAAALLLVCASLPALAQSLTEKLCIFAAARQMPAIPGLVIMASRIKDTPKDLVSKDGSTTNLMTEIDVNAAGVSATFTFVCATGPGKPVFAQSVGMAR